MKNPVWKSSIGPLRLKMEGRREKSPPNSRTEFTRITNDAGDGGLLFLFDESRFSLANVVLPKAIGVGIGMLNERLVVVTVHGSVQDF